MTPINVTKLMATTAAGLFLLLSVPVLASDRDERMVLNKVTTELKTTSMVQFDSRSRLVIRWQPGAEKAGAIDARSIRLMGQLRTTVLGGRDFKVLDTDVRTSRFGSVAFSTIQLNGIPVLDHYLKIQTAPDGSMKSAELSIPPDFKGLKVWSGKPAVTMDQAAQTIRRHALERHNGLICPDQAQLVWFPGEDLTLVPAARMLLKGADLTRLFEAVVDLRTGAIVRFVDIARR